jgi:alanyl-tRNA synthetase
VSTPKTADELRSAFLRYFTEREHVLVPSSGLIPTHPAAPLFTNAGMVQFLPYFFGEETPPYARATSSQKCVRVRGKHDDIESIGRTTRHLTFFEMLGNFSFGDYFKQGAIEYAWVFLTEVLGMDGDRLWATVHESDDEAWQLWHDAIGLPEDRIQRLGEDNFWEMSATGPCGPSSEIFLDKGPQFGREGGPKHGGEERFVEIWNLVFMASNRLADGSLEPLPKKNIDTGAGMERILPLIQGKSSVFDTDVLRRLIGTAEEVTGSVYGKDAETDVSLRILADHARAVTFLLADGVVPSNEERGYVLRKIIRRAALHGRRAGAKRGVLPTMAAAVTDVMRTGYPELDGALGRVQASLEREEDRFRETLSLGLGLLDNTLPAGASEIPGDLAFKLHDTYGFPIDLTREVAEQRGIGVDEDGFQAAMDRQRTLARAAGNKADAADQAANARLVLDRFGTTRFRGYETLAETATVVEVFPAADERGLEVFVDASPFYPAGGGQVGDTGWITSDHGRGRVVDTDAPLAGVIRHVVELEDGSITAGERVQLEVDRERRAALRRSHTGTHLLHWALRQVLGSHASQQGSLVAPDYLRFDFNHHAPLDDDELYRVERLVAEQIRGNASVEVVYMSQAEAKALGALSFFGEKYDQTVRVVRAGDHSVELCGGTHVGALGEIGGLVIRAESSIGANLRRIEALVGAAAYEENHRLRTQAKAAARLLRATPDDLLDAIRRLQEAQRTAERERRQLIAEVDQYAVRDLVRGAVRGAVIARYDGRDQADLRRLATTVLAEPGINVVALVGSPDGSSVAIAVAVDDETIKAPELARVAARAVGGGGSGRDARIAVAGGRDATRIGEALDLLRSAIGEEVAHAAQ